MVMITIMILMMIMNTFYGDVADVDGAESTSLTHSNTSSYTRHGTWCARRVTCDV